MSILVAARWGSVALMVIVLLMMTYIICLRAVLLMRERRYRQAVRAVDSDTARGRCEESQAPADRFSRRTVPAADTVEHAARAERAGCGNLATGWAASPPSRKTRLPGPPPPAPPQRAQEATWPYVTLGQLRDRLEWPRLCQIAQSGHPLLSLAATQAIARIDPAAATGTVVFTHRRNLNWPAAKIARYLENIGPQRCIRASRAPLLLQAPESHRPGLIPFLAVCKLLHRAADRAANPARASRR